MASTVSDVAAANDHREEDFGTPEEQTVELEIEPIFNLSGLLAEINVEEEAEGGAEAASQRMVLDVDGRQMAPLFEFVQIQDDKFDGLDPDTFFFF